MPWVGRCMPRVDGLPVAAQGDAVESLALDIELRGRGGVLLVGALDPAEGVGMLDWNRAQALAAALEIREVLPGPGQLGVQPGPAPSRPAVLRRVSS